MRRLAVLAIAMLLPGLILLGARLALAHDVTIPAVTTFATLDGGPEDHDGLANGCFTVSDGNLTLATGGSITNNDVGVPGASAGAICIVVSGDMDMQAGSSILAENTNNGGNGGPIDITVGGDMTLSGPSGATPGAKISSSKTAGAGDTGVAGNITITVGDFVAVPPTGDLVLEPGSQVLANANGPAGAIVMTAAHFASIDGEVFSHGSTAAGRGGPITITAGCNLSISDAGTVSSEGRDPGADRVHLEGGCAVTVFGLVESIGPGHGAINNLCNPPDRPDKPVNSAACVEVWSGDSLTINHIAPHKGEINADTAQSGGVAGIAWIDLYAFGDITILGPATGAFVVHANQSLGNGHGGLITVTSVNGDVLVTGLAIQADNVAAGGDGGSITAEASGNVTLSDATLFARGDFTGADVGKGGTISLRAFNGAVSWLDPTDPPADVGDVRPTGTGVTPNANPAQDPQRGVITFQDCAAGPVITTGTTFPFNGAAATTPTTLADACGGAPTLPAYVVLPDCPCGGSPADGTCDEDPLRVLTRSVDPTGATHGAVPNHLTVQDAYDAASDGEVIGLFGNTIENIILGDAKTLTITQCTLARVTAADSSLPVWNITTTGLLVIIGPDAVGGTIGWRVQSNAHELRGVRATGASQFGILVLGNNNSVSWNSVRDSAVGIRVEGDVTDLRGGTVELNTGDGVQLGATANTNVLRGATVQNNGGNGVLVQGAGNTVRDNGRVNANGLNGILVSGTGNIVRSNRSDGNTQDGFNVTGNSNTLQDNKANKNVGDGFEVAGTGNKLKGNASNQGNPGGSSENGGAEYNLLSSAVNQGGNKADNIGIPKTSAPAKCPTFPAAGVCE
jgi:hypothetical protein